MSEPIRIFVGYDPREATGFHILVSSLLRHASEPISITPITLDGVKSFYSRERDPLQSTDFSFTRFLTPYLAGYAGWAIYMDCDMLALSDIARLWGLRDERFALMCVKHQHEPSEQRKAFNEIQTRYARKNWSSLMLMNCARCRDLKPEYVASAKGLDLHQFVWLEYSEIGSLPASWNHLVDYDATPADIDVLHYTLGTPDWRLESGFAEPWQMEWARIHP